MSELRSELLTAHAELNAALAKAQAKFPPIKREREVTIKSDKGSYKYSYAPLDVILDAVRKPLTDNGIALVQLLEGADGIPCIRTELRHQAGAAIGSSLPLPRMPDRPQELGSLLTYFRRYAVMAILGIAAEEDDDGQAAQQASANGAKMSQAQTRKLYALMKDLDELRALPWPPHADWKAAVDARCHELYEHGMKDLTKDQASQVIEAMTAHVKAVMENPEKPEEVEGIQVPLVPEDESIPF